MTEAEIRAKAESIDHNEDRYPDFMDAVNGMIENVDIPDGPIERLELTFLASGEATYRVWPARAEEPIGGYIPPLS